VNVICSWCEAEGKPAVVREKEPLDDPEETHGVCPEHKALLSAPDAIVPPHRQAAGGHSFLDSDGFLQHRGG
jgi:hypothetical protein